ncbi:MAG TPA: tRNA uridine-5-carboxymethylaminomethyl(34) synthesis GTPase MnmE, partial [Bacteroidota bacterium]|nr:tRNA uridine-5-carboxymethylaminomethyl(34) synthesis GTPase MnmE [Bacteroidota bacterium]
MFQDDVIAAVATPIGEGGLAVVRVSGKNAIQVVDQGFRGKRRLASARTHTAHFGHFANRTGEVIDEIIATVYKEPSSYTGENSCEISCHGGVFVIKSILSSLIEFGCRLAQP